MGKKHFLVLALALVLGVAVIVYITSSPRPEAQEIPVIHKVEEMLFVKYDGENHPDPFLVYDESGEFVYPRETIVLEGQANLDGSDLLESTLRGHSNLLNSDLTLGVSGNFQYQGKFPDLDFPADARLTKNIQILAPGTWRWAYSGDEPSPFITKIEEGIIKRFPPLWGDPLCFIADPQNPIAVYEEIREPEPHYQLLGWIIKNCNQFWAEKYYGTGLPEEIPAPLITPLSQIHDTFRTKVELQLDSEANPTVLEGTTEIRTLSDAGGNNQIPIEIVSMKLSSATPLGLITINSNHSNQLSTGAVQSLFGDGHFPAESFFDVFFDIDLPQAEGGEIVKYHPYTYDGRFWRPGVPLTGRIKEIPWWWSASCYQDEIRLYTDDQINSGDFSLGEPPTADKHISGFCHELVPLDFGDAPDSYSTLLSSNGARHQMPGGNTGLPRLGELIDAESDGQPSTSALGDDLNNDDEDGVIFERLASGAIFGSVAVSGSGYLNAWADLNADGDFDDDGEQIFEDEEFPNGEIGFEFTPATSFGLVYMRFRVDSDGGLAYSGEARNGEVEDYVIQVLPSLAGFDSVIEDDGELTVSQGGETVAEFPPGTNFLTNVEIVSEPGLVIVNGAVLPEEETKTLHVDIDSGSGYLCILDKAGVRLEEMPSRLEDCSGTVISCPQESFPYPCAISGGQYIVSGLSHTGIGEVPPPSPPPVSAPVAGGAVPLFILQQQQQQRQQQLAPKIAQAPAQPELPVGEPEAVGEVGAAPKEIVLSSRDSIWNIAKRILGKGATTGQINKLTKEILKANGICERNWGMTTGCRYDSRRLHGGIKIVIPVSN